VVPVYYFGGRIILEVLEKKMAGKMYGHRMNDISGQFIMLYNE